jgi:hypothetical protein
MDLTSQIKTVHGMNQFKYPDGLPDLVPLEMADQVPLNRSADGLDLPQRLLDTTLAESKRPGVHHFPDPIGHHPFGYDDQRDPAGVPPHPFCRSNHSLANPPEGRGDG